MTQQNINAGAGPKGGDLHFHLINHRLANVDPAWRAGSGRCLRGLRFGSSRQHHCGGFLHLLQQESCRHLTPVITKAKIKISSTICPNVIQLMMISLGWDTGVFEFWHVLVQLKT